MKSTLAMGFSGFAKVNGETLTVVSVVMKVGES
jgi:hypothetical protein